METIQSSFPPLNNIITQYNTPLYSSVYKIHFFPMQKIQFLGEKEQWFHAIHYKKESALEFIISNLEKQFNMLYEICDDEVQDKMKDERDKYMEEGKENGKTYYRIKKEHKNEKTLYEFLSMLNQMWGRDKLHSFSISEEHIR